MNNENEIVLRKFRDLKSGAEFDLKTAFVERVVPVPTPVSVPLYVDGQMIPEQELAELGLEIVGYTQAQLDAVTYPAMFAANPDLAPRVRVYKKYLDNLKLGYNATSDEIDVAISACADLDKTAQLELSTRIMAALHDIEVNLTMTGGIGQEAWAIMPKLIQYLPAEEIRQ